MSCGHCSGVCSLVEPCGLLSECGPNCPETEVVTSLCVLRVVIDKPECHYRDRSLRSCNKANVMRGRQRETKERGEEKGRKNKRPISLEMTTDRLKGNKRVEERCGRKRSGGMSEEVRQSRGKKWKQGHRGKKRPGVIDSGENEKDRMKGGVNRTENG